MCDGKDEMRVCLKNSHKYEARTDQWEAAGPDGRNAITWELATVGLGANARLASSSSLFSLLWLPDRPQTPSRFVFKAFLAIREASLTLQMTPVPYIRSIRTTARRSPRPIINHRVRRDLGPYLACYPHSCISTQRQCICMASGNRHLCSPPLALPQQLHQL